MLVNAETDDYPVDKFDEHIRHNVRSAFLKTKYALPHLCKTKGNVISAGSEGGVRRFTCSKRGKQYGGFVRKRAFLPSSDTAVGAGGLIMFGSHYSRIMHLK